MSSLNEADAVHNNQRAMDLLERELSIPPVMAASDMASSQQIDKLSMVLYLTQVKDGFTRNNKGTEVAVVLRTGSQPRKQLNKLSSFVFLQFFNKKYYNNIYIGLYFFYKTIT